MNKPTIMTPISASVKGEYKCTVLNGATREVVRETPWFDNLITNIGLDRLGSDQNIYTHCRIGTGSTTPANSDTALVSQSASTSTIASAGSANSGATAYTSTRTTVFEFALGAVVGNMAEVGVGWSASTASTLFSRALINNAGGSPTTITVLSTEILQVTYRLTIYPQLADATGSVVISGTSYNYTSRCFNAGVDISLSANQLWSAAVSSVTAYTGSIQAVTAAAGSGTSTPLTAGSMAAYTAGNKYRDFTASAAVGGGNLSGGIKTVFVLWYSGYTQIEFTPAIPKTSTNTLSLTFRLSWNRH